jgi:hypothetical protein
MNIEKFKKFFEYEEMSVCVDERTNQPSEITLRYLTPME